MNFSRTKISMKYEYVT